MEKRKRRRKTGTEQASLFLWLTLLGVGVADAAGDSTRMGEVALSGRSYWRYHLTFRPAWISTGRSGGKPKEIYLLRRGGFQTGLATPLPWSPAPPPEWYKPDFDDRHWPRQRLPVGFFMIDQDAYLSNVDEVGDNAIHLLSLRGRFEVPDPEAVRRLHLELEYAGGVVVYLNGREVARQHLPAGHLTDETPALDYPPLAYRRPFAGRTHGLYRYKRREADLAEARRIIAARRRLLSTDLPTKLLRPGTNILAIQVRRSRFSPVVKTYSAGHPHTYTAVVWPHLKVFRLALRGFPAGSVLPQGRPRGVEAWTEDIHRIIYADEFGDGRPPLPVRIVGVRNGIFCGQVVVGTDRPLHQLRLSTTPLRSPTGGFIPPERVEVLYGVSRPLSETCGGPLGFQLLSRHTPPPTLEPYPSKWRYVDGTNYRRLRRWFAREAPLVRFFDALSPSSPQVVPAGTCQPIWLRLHIPKNASAGQYSATLTISARDIKPIQLPLHLEIIDWTLPDPSDYRSFLGLEQSPDSLAEVYRVRPFSEAHWRLIDASFRLMGQAGANLLMLPLTRHTEMGNAESMLIWVRRGDGGFDFDFSLIDRYLHTARKHCDLRAIIGLVHTPTSLGDSIREVEVTVRERGGKLSHMRLPDPGQPKGAKLWGLLARAVHQHLKEKGLADRLHWGLPWDRRDDYLLGLMRALKQAVPSVGWAQAHHEGGYTEGPAARYLSLDIFIRFVYPPVRWNGRRQEVRSYQGWRGGRFVFFARCGGQTPAVYPQCPLRLYRQLMEGAICCGIARAGKPQVGVGFCGVARLAADRWAAPPPGGFSWIGAPTIRDLLLPGPEGPLTTTRFEILREGIQEAEARIALERKGADRIPEVKRILDARLFEIWNMPYELQQDRLPEWTMGWQECSRLLFTAASRFAN